MKRLSILINLSMLFIPACSRLELAATWVDSFITTQIDQYFEMSSMQSLFVKKAVKEDIDKVKKEIFPRVAGELENIKVLAENNATITQKIVEAHYNEIKNSLYAGLKVFEPNAQQFVQKLSDVQIDRFDLEFKRKTKELKHDLANPDEAKEKRFHSLRGQIEMWIGSLTEAQKLDLQKFADQNLIPIKEMMRNRDKIAGEFLASFKNPEKRKAFVKELFTNYESMRDPIYTKTIENDQQKYFDLIVTIINKMNSKQRLYLIQILNERITEMKKMSEDKKSKLSLLLRR